MINMFIFSLSNFKINDDSFIVDVSTFNVENILFSMTNHIFLLFKYNFMMQNYFSLFSRVKIKQTRLILSKSLFFIMIRK